MTPTPASCSSSADRRARWPAVVLLAAALMVTGCTSGTVETPGSGGTPGKTPNVRPDERLRQSLAAGLNEIGARREADFVTRGGSRITELRAEGLGPWQVYRVDYRQLAHPIRFHVASNGGRTIVLTGKPKAFETLTTGVPEPASPKAAASIARLYVETTRDSSELLVVISSVEEIGFRKTLSDSAERRRDEVLRKYRSVVTAPKAKSGDDGFTTTLYQVRDESLERREVRITGSGRIHDETEELAGDLPVPYAV